MQSPTAPAGCEAARHQHMVQSFALPIYCVPSRVTTILRLSPDKLKTLCRPPAPPSEHEVPHRQDAVESPTLPIDCAPPQVTTILRLSPEKLETLRRSPQPKKLHKHPPSAPISSDGGPPIEERSEGSSYSKRAGEDDLSQLAALTKKTRYDIVTHTLEVLASIEEMEELRGSMQERENAVQIMEEERKEKDEQIEAQRIRIVELEEQVRLKDRKIASFEKEEEARKKRYAGMVEEHCRKLKAQLNDGGVRGSGAQ
jgi:hypothetical protein